MDGTEDAVEEGREGGAEVNRRPYVGRAGWRDGAQWSGNPFRFARQAGQ